MGLRENLHQDTIAALSLRKALTVNKAVTVREAVKMMGEHSLGAVIVLDDNDIPVSMFTEKLLIKLLAQSPAAMDEPVASHASQRIVCLSRNESIATLISTMQEHALRWVCVVDEQGKAEALTGLRGVMAYVTDSMARLLKVQPMESRLSMQQREGA